MSNHLSLQVLAQLQPWRRGKGQPRNALDPTWVPSVLDNPCEGEIEWEGDTSWWVCKRCGYVGSACFTHHKTVVSPGLYFLHSVLFFLKRRAERPPPVAPPQVLTEVVRQMLFIAGAALRYAAVQRSEELGEYVDRLVVD